MRIALGALRGIRNADEVEQLHRPAPRGGGVRGLMGAHRLGNLPPDAMHRVQRRHRLLKDHRHLAAAHAAHRAIGERQQVGGAALPVGQQHAAGDDATRRRREQTHDGQRGHAFAGAALADDRERLALGDGEGDAFEGRDLPGIGAEADGEILHLQQRRHHAPSMRGSSASRNPSPTKLKLATARVMTPPGSSASQGAVVRYSCALLSILPQLGVGGWMP